MLDAMPLCKSCFPFLSLDLQSISKRGSQQWKKGQRNLSSIQQNTLAFIMSKQWSVFLYRRWELPWEGSFRSCYQSDLLLLLPLFPSLLLLPRPQIWLLVQLCSGPVVKYVLCQLVGVVDQRVMLENAEMSDASSAYCWDAKILTDHGADIAPTQIGSQMPMI